tara:strand:- start:278 stop:838 length:561 start_codon:yes stop_codon:yes gene_type:complete
MSEIRKPTSEIKLIAALNRGEERAYIEVLNLHKQQITKTVIGMLGAVVEAQDVSQEVFVRFFKNVHNFKGEAKISTYLTRIAINLSLNELEKRKRKWKVFSSGDFTEDKLKNAFTDDHTELDEQLVLLRRAILMLDNKYKEVVVLRAVQGFSFKEIAEVLALPIGTVLTRFSRAQRKLTELLIIKK